MNKGYKNSMRMRFGALLLALLFTLGSATGLLGNVFSTVFTAEAATTYTADNYYDSLDTSKTGKAFRAELADLITDTHTKLTSYSDLEWVFETADADPDREGYIIWFYTGTSVKYNGFGGSTGATNREHVWPKDGGAAFPEKDGPGADAHHLRPTEQQLNSTRGSISFGEVPQTTGNIVKENGKTNYGATADELCYKSGGFFYPAKGYRGATARILMYMQVRWGDQYSLKFVTGQGDCKTIGDIETLMKWHLEEPPTEAEKRRNEAVFAVQGNRNPFIDHPEYASKIFCNDGESYNSVLKQVVETYGDYGTGGTGTNPGTPTLTLSLSSLSLSVGETRKITATAAPSGTSNEVIWYSEDSSIASVAADGTITAHANGAVKVTATLKANTSVTASVNVTVKSITGIRISGTPTKTVYSEGDVFNPAGLTVYLVYSDGSQKFLSNTSCEWVDSTTGFTALTLGATSVACRYGDHIATYEGITVREASGGTFTITSSSFTGSGAYAWVPWTSGEFAGEGYMYPGNKTEIQMNNSKPSRYLYNTTPLSGGIVTITIKDDRGTGKLWEVRTSATPFEQASGVPATGTSHGSKSVTADGVTWVLDTTDSYFAICYVDSGAAYLASIEITYGAVSAECQHTRGEVELTATPSFTASGELTKTCSHCGEVLTEFLPILNKTDYQTSEGGTVYSYLYGLETFTFRPFHFDAPVLELQDGYRLQFRIPAAMLETIAPDAYEVTLTTASGLTARYENACEETVNGSCVFTLPGIAPDRMVDAITATLTVTADGADYTTEMTYSAVDYCYERLELTEDADERRALVDLLHYIAAAQFYTGHGIDDPADMRLTNEQNSWGTQTAEAFASIYDREAVVVENATAEWLGASVTLTDTFALSVTFSSPDVETFDVRVTVGGTLCESTTLITNDDGTYTVVIDGIGLTDFDAEILLSVTDGEGGDISNTLRYSVASYVVDTHQSTDDRALWDLLGALMRLASE